MNKKGEKAVSGITGLILPIRFTLAVTVAVDGTKLPFTCSIRRKTKCYSGEATVKHFPGGCNRVRTEEIMDGQQYNVYCTTRSMNITLRIY